MVAEATGLITEGNGCRDNWIDYCDTELMTQSKSRQYWLSLWLQTLFFYQPVVPARLSIPGLHNLN